MGQPMLFSKTVYHQCQLFLLIFFPLEVSSILINNAQELKGDMDPFTNS